MEQLFNICEENKIKFKKNSEIFKIKLLNSKKRLRITKKKLSNRQHIHNTEKNGLTYFEIPLKIPYFIFIQK